MQRVLEVLVWRLERRGRWRLIDLQYIDMCIAKYQEYDDSLIQYHLSRTEELQQVIPRYSRAFRVMYEELEHRICDVEERTGFALVTETAASIEREIA